MKPNYSKVFLPTLLGLGVSLSLSTPLAQAATPKDTLVIAKNIDDIISLDPAEVYEPSAGEVINNVYNRLFSFKPGDFTKVVGDVAEKWTVARDGKTFTIHLRQGLTFASGHKLTAADVAFSLQRVVILGKSPAFILTQFGWTADNVKTQVTAPDDRTVVLKLSDAFAPSFLLNALSSSVTSIVDRQEVLAHQSGNDQGYNWLKSTSAGSGAYRISSWQAKDSVVLDANARFWHGAPKLKHVVLRHVPEAASQRLLLEKGDVDVARNLTPDQIPALANNKQLSLLTTPGTELLYLGLNQNVPVLANPQVREALRWLVDYQGLSRTVLKGQYNVHQSFLGKGTANALTDTPYHLDVAKAKALLAKAHLSNGFDLTLDVMNSSPFTDIAQSIQSTFAQAGVRVKLLPADAKQVWTKFRGRATQAALVYWVPDYLDPQSSADFFTNNPDNSANGKVKNAAWRVAWNIPGLTKETRAALLEPNAAKRGADYLNLQRKVQKDSPFVFLFQKTDQTVIRSNLHHFIVGPSWDTPVYWGASK